VAAVFAAVILPIANIMYFSRRYQNADKLDVEKKEDRMLPLIAGVIGYIVGVALLLLLEAPWLATVLMICYAVVTFAILLITPYWKISVHSCGVIGPSVGLAVAFWPVGLVYFLLLPPIIWSRYVLKKHTPLQLVMGALVGFVITAIIFWIAL
jgi:membrane-associated phospholipid phosphatase